MEKRAFYRALSGLHASINVHLCAEYLLQAPPRNGPTFTTSNPSFGHSNGHKNGAHGSVIDGGVWGRNVDEFVKRFSPENTNGNLFFIIYSDVILRIMILLLGEGPQWLQNLYFVYLLELRAIAKAAPYLRNNTYFTGDSDQDEDIKMAVKQVVDLVE